MERNEFESEWCFLQNQFESYEKHSLYIKIISILVLLSAEISGVISVFIVLILVVLWIQDSIWKTFQSRLEPRLFQIEKYISEKTNESAFQFNREYHKVCLSGLSLVGEYTRQAIRPTVAFPHVVLILTLIGQCVFW